MNEELDAGIVNRLIGAIYDAALAPDLWEKFMRSACTAFQGSSSLFMQLDSAHPDRSITRIQGIDPKKSAEMLGHFEKDGKCQLRLATVPGGSVVTASDFVRSEYDAGLHANRDLDQAHYFRYLLGSVVHNSDDRQFCVLFARRDDALDFAPQHSNAMRMLIPHLQKAYRLQNQLALTQSYELALDAMPVGVAILDKEGTALFVNQRATACLQRDDGLALCQGRLRFGNCRDQETFDSLLGSAVAAHGQDAAECSLTTAQLPGTPPYQISLRALGPDSGAARLVENARCMVMIQDPGSRAAPTVEHLRGAFGMTRAEAQVCLHLFDGYSLPETADKLNISRNTAKTHLKNIFEKCQVSSQNQLIRLLALGL